MKSAKQTRQARIQERLRSEQIETHEGLAQALLREGIEVSQSTLSKDLRELGVVRLPRFDGGFRYALPDGGRGVQGRQIVERELRDCVLQVDTAGNITVILTLSGHAQAVCEAVDRMDWPEVMGTLAGENTMFGLCGTPAQARGLASRVGELRRSGDMGAPV